MELDEDDERDALILKLQEVNEKLKFKLKDLEVVVEQTVESNKGQINTHREWDTQDDTLKEKDKQLKEYQVQIEACKKTVRGLKNRLSALTNMEKMVNVNNELKDAERRRKELEDEVRILKKNNKYQEKALGKLADDTDYESKMQALSNELASLKEQYKTMGKEHKAKEMAQLEHHKKLVAAEEENARLKRILIALKNHKDPFEGLNNMEELLQGGRKEVDAYEQAIKSEEKRHKLKLKKMEESKQAIEEEIKELNKQIKDAEQENHQTASKIKTRKKMIKENQEKMKKILIEQREIEEKEEEKRLTAREDTEQDEDIERDDESRGRSRGDKDDRFYKEQQSDDDDDRKDRSAKAKDAKGAKGKDAQDSPRFDKTKDKGKNDSLKEEKKDTDKSKQEKPTQDSIKNDKSAKLLSNVDSSKLDKSAKLPKDEDPKFNKSSKSPTKQESPKLDKSAKLGGKDTGTKADTSKKADVSNSPLQSSRVKK